MRGGLPARVGDPHFLSNDAAHPSRSEETAQRASRKHFIWPAKRSLNRLFSSWGGEEH